MREFVRHIHFVAGAGMSSLAEALLRLHFTDFRDGGGARHA